MKNVLHFKLIAIFSFLDKKLISNFEKWSFALNQCPLVLDGACGFRNLSNFRTQKLLTVRLQWGTKTFPTVVFENWERQNQKRQISEVTQCKLKRIGTLDFDHRWGACSNVDDREIYLCFSRYEVKQCRAAVDPLAEFIEITPSTYKHLYARTAASPSNF